MKASYFLALFSAFAALSAGASSARRPAKRSYGTHDYYVLEFDSARGISIEECAATLGAEVVEPVGELPNYWLLRSQKDGMKHTLLERLRALQGAHSGSLDTPPTAPGLDKRSLVPAAVKRLELQVPRQRVKRAAIPAPLPQDDGSHSLARDIAARLGIEDPLFPSQWHLVNDDNPEHMLNATPLWDIGIMGEGVISALVDDGLEFESEDLKDNFVRILVVYDVSTLPCVCDSELNIYARMRRAHTISMTMLTFPSLCFTMTTTGHDVRDRSLL